MTYPYRILNEDVTLGEKGNVWLSEENMKNVNKLHDF